MVLSWNTAITVFFLPGHPALWMFMAVINFGIAILHRIVQKRQAFLPAPSIALTLLALLAIVLLTAKFRGGAGVQALGSSTYGGKAYYYIIASIIGYFALISQPIPPERAKLYVVMFLLPGVLGALSHLVYYAGPAFYFLYLIIPAGFAGGQALSANAPITRLGGFWTAATAISHCLLAVYGIRGIFQKWWRIALLVAVLALGALGGYRSFLVLFFLVFAFVFVLEGLLRSPLFPALLLVGALGFTVLIPVASKLPAAVQRTLSFLPLKIDSSIRNDANGSIDWRLQIWEAMLPELPKYVWFGKGYAMDPMDIYLTQQAVLRGRAPDYEGSILAGDYHSGPLSTYVPFGSFGLLAFLAFLTVSARALQQNYRYGRAEMQTHNRFLYAYFLTRMIFFIFMFGSLFSDLYQFVGTIGLSIALNNGICRKPAPVPKPVRFRPDLELRPAQPRVA